MNILFVIKRYPSYGGIQVVTTMLGERFVSDGHNVIIAALMSPLFEGVDEMLPKNIRVVKLPEHIWLKKNIDHLRKIVLEEKIDIIVNQWALRFDVGFACHQAIKNTKCKMVSVLHGAPDTTKFLIEQEEKVNKSRNVLSRLFNKQKLSFYHLITKLSVHYVYRISDAYVLLSEGFIPKLIEYANLKEHTKLCAIGNAVAISDDGFVYNSQSKEKTILYVGRMDLYNKRVNRIIEVWEKIYNDYPNWELKLVGEGPQLSQLKEYVSNHNIERVKFYGFQKEPPRKFYEKSSILMLTSDLEGFGLVIIEAMQFGVIPVVYGSYVAVYDIINNGIDGFITPSPYSSKCTEDCIRRLIENQEMREQMAKSAMLKSKQFSQDNIVKKWYKLFNNL